MLRHIVTIRVISALKHLKKKKSYSDISCLYLGLNSVVFCFYDQKGDDNINESASEIYTSALPATEEQYKVCSHLESTQRYSASQLETPSTARSRCIDHVI